MIILDEVNCLLDIESSFCQMESDWILSSLNGVGLRLNHSFSKIPKVWRYSWATIMNTYKLYFLWDCLLQVSGLKRHITICNFEYISGGVIGYNCRSIGSSTRHNLILFATIGDGNCCCYCVVVATLVRIFLNKKLADISFELNALELFFS